MNTEKIQVREKLDYRDLCSVSEVFLAHPDIVDVEVFGSVARDGRGNDLDLILVVEDKQKEVDFYEGMQAELQKSEGDRDFYSLADKVLKNGSVLLKTAMDLVDGRINILVHEKNWRDRVHDIQKNYMHYDPMFLQNLKRDAKSIKEVS